MFNLFKKNSQKYISPENEFIPPDKQLKNIIDFAERILSRDYTYDTNNMHSIFSFIKILSDKITLDGVYNIIGTLNTYNGRTTSTASTKTVDSTYYNSRSGAIPRPVEIFDLYQDVNNPDFFIPFMPFKNNDYEKKVEIEFLIKLATCPVVNIRWDIKKHFNSNIITILPIGLTVIYADNYSEFCGMLKSSEKIKVCKIYDITKIYNHIYFDGTYYRRSDDNEIICKSPSFEFGCIFEIGRLISKSKIRFLEEEYFGKIFDK